MLGREDSLAYAPWPAFDEKLLVSDTFNLPIQVEPGFHVDAVHREFTQVSAAAHYMAALVWQPAITLSLLMGHVQQYIAQMQVNGKLRGTVEVAKDIAQEEAEAIGREQEGVAKFLNGKEIKKTIFVPGRILNFIVGK